ncbi:MAG: lipopolysaccharide kinase InaA family protein, partial [Planctomycetales bacterium]|nr:lipopolysaccharide kinase InaA family protein [Planctomycetales bacterium]
MFATRIVVTDPGRAACEALGVRTAADVLALPGGRVVSRSRTRSMVSLDVGGGTLYLKRYRYPTARHVLRGLLRGTLLGRSRVRREWENFARLRMLGWGTPEPLLRAEVRRFGFLRGAALLTRGVEGAERLDAAMARLGAAGAPERRGLARALAGAVRRLHDAGYVDGDLHPRNVLVRR